jgi:hypothetical protein
MGFLVFLQQSIEPYLCKKKKKDLTPGWRMIHNDFYLFIPFHLVRKFRLSSKIVRFVYFTHPRQSRTIVNII